MSIKPKVFGIEFATCLWCGLGINKTRYIVEPDEGQPYTQGYTQILMFLPFIYIYLTIEIVGWE